MKAEKQKRREKRREREERRREREKSGAREREPREPREKAPRKSKSWEVQGIEEEVVACGLMAIADRMDTREGYRGRGSYSNYRGRGGGGRRGRGGNQNFGGRGGNSNYRGGSYRGRGRGGYHGGGGDRVQGIDKLAELHGHEDLVRVVTPVTEPSGRQVLYSAGQDCSVRVWDLSLPRNQQCTNCVTVGADVGSVLVASGWLFVGIPGRVKAWNMSDGRQVDLVGHQGQIHSIVPYTEQGMIFSGGEDRSILAWRFNQQTSAFEQVGAMHGHSGAILELQVVGNLLFSGSMDGTIRVWDLNSAQCIHTCQAHNMPVMGILVWENHLLSCSLDGTIKVWTWNAPNLDLTYTHTVIPNEQVGVLGMCGSLNAQQKPVLVSACNDNTIRFFELPSFDSLGVLKQRKDVRCVSSGPGAFFAGHSDGTVRAWKWV